MAAVVGLDPPARLTCFGGSSLTFNAKVSKPISDCGVGPRIAPTWFCLPGVLLTAPNNAADSGLTALAAYWDPRSGLTPKNFPLDKQLSITGHFDDPAASTCHVTDLPKGQSPEPSAAVILACRQAFIATAVH